MVIKNILVSPVEHRYHRENTFGNFWDVRFHGRAFFQLDELQSTPREIKSRKTHGGDNYSTFAHYDDNAIACQPARGVERVLSIFADISAPFGNRTYYFLFVDIHNAAFIRTDDSDQVRFIRYWHDAHNILQNV